MSENSLNIEKILAEYAQFQADNPGFAEIIILTSTGELEYGSDPTFCSKEEAKPLFDAWMNHGSAVEIGGNRYPVLSWEVMQFAARNVKGKGALVGCKTKTDRYVVVHLEAKVAPTMAAIKFNRWSWDVI